MEDKKYSGYFCNKCNYIPLMKIYPKNKDIKIYSSCKCCKHYENIESFMKNRYRNNIIDIDKICKDSPNDSINHDYLFGKETLEPIIKKFNEDKIKIIEEGIKVKNQLIDIFKKKIEEVDQIYQKYSEKNGKILLFMEQLIKSYELVRDNKSNIMNVLSNCIFKENKKVNYFEKFKDLETLSKNIENYFCDKYIISNLDTSTSFIGNNSYYSPLCVKNLIVLDDNIFAFCYEKSKEIIIINSKIFKGEIFSMIAHNKNVEYIIKSYNNNIISYGDDNIIKIWPIIDRNLLTKISNCNPNKTEGNLFNLGDIMSEKKIINLNPLFEYITSEKNENILKVIQLKEDKFLIINKNNLLLLFKYSINNIELIKKYQYTSNLIDAFSFHKNNNEIIAIVNNTSVNFLELDNFKSIKNIPVRYMTKNSIIQINLNEILIADGFSYKIIDLNNFTIKLNIKNENKKNFLLNLNDGTFIQNTGVDIRRYFIKTMEELPLFLEFIFEDNYDDEYDYNNYSDNIVNSIYKCNNEKIIICYKNGRITDGYLKYN